MIDSLIAGGGARIELNASLTKRLALSQEALIVPALDWLTDATLLLDATGR